MKPTPAAPDFNHLAAQFDRFLPKIEPVTTAILEHLPALPKGATVLDVACGTGEPGLTLARRSPEIQLMGVDQAEALIGVARAKASREGLSNARFSVMPMTTLTLPDASVDAALSRFGLLMFGDVEGSAEEIARVLRPGAPYSLAVWDDPSKNTLMNALVAQLQPHLPADHRSPMEALEAWAAEGRRARLLEGLGLAPAGSEMFAWDYRFENFDEAWALVTSMGKFTGQAELGAEAQEAVRKGLTTALAGFRMEDGGYVIPHACRLFWGQRASA